MNTNSDENQLYSLFVIEYLSKASKVKISYHKFLNQIKEIESKFPDSILFFSNEPYHLGNLPNHDLYIQLDHDYPGESELWDLYLLFLVGTVSDNNIRYDIIPLLRFDDPYTIRDDFPSSGDYNSLRLP